MTAWQLCALNLKEEKKIMLYKIEIKKNTENDNDAE